MTDNHAHSKLILPAVLATATANALTLVNTLFSLAYLWCMVALRVDPIAGKIHAGVTQFWGPHENRDPVPIFSRTPVPIISVILGRDPVSPVACLALLHANIIISYSESMSIGYYTLYYCTCRL